MSVINGNGLNNILRGNGFGNEINGVGGNDTLFGRGGNDTLNGGAGSDEMNGGFETGANNDSLLGDATNDSVGGQDTLIGGVGNDTIDGGANIDLARYINNELTAASFTASGSSWTVNAGTEGADELTNVEQVLDADGDVFLLVGSGGYATLQEAIDAASDGDTILIGPGSFAGGTVSGKALTIIGRGDSGMGATTLTSQLTVSGVLNGEFTVRDLAVDVDGASTYGIFVDASSDSMMGSVTLDNVTISDAQENGFAYVRAGNAGTPSQTDTIGTVTITDSAFVNNGRSSGSTGRGDVVLFGYNGDLTITDTDFSNTDANARKAIQMRGTQQGGDVAGIGPFAAAGNVEISGIEINGAYASDVIAFYRISGFASFTGSDNLVVATRGAGASTDAGLEPWALINFDSVGDDLDISGFFSAGSSNTASPAGVGAQPWVIGSMQGLSSNDSFTGTDGFDSMNGRAGEDTLDGGAGNDLIIGGAGLDSLSGGAGNDSGDDLFGAAVSDLPDAAIAGGAGTDTLRIFSGTGTVTLGSEITSVEHIEVATSTATLGAVFTGTSAVNIDASGATGVLSITGNNGANALTGGAGDQTISGNGGDDSLSGGGGNDSLNGGTGTDAMAGGQNDDTYAVDDTTDTVAEQSDEGDDLVISTVNYTLSDHVERLTLVGSGLAGTGNAQDNTIIGTGGEDTLDGGEGADRMEGGAGNDVYYVDDLGDMVVEDAGEGAGIDLVYASVSHTLADNVENLTLTGTDSAEGIGNSLDNIIIGNEADNLLDGGEGNDSLYGGEGNDTYHVDSLSDLVSEDPGEGHDIVFSSVDHTLTSDVEDLVLEGSADYGAGNELGNEIHAADDVDSTLEGAAGNDSLFGAEGSDSLMGGEGADEITAGSGDDTAAGGDHDDRIFGGEGSDSLMGGEGADEITAGSGDDTAAGGDHNDRIFGGEGADLLQGDAGNDSMLGEEGDDDLFGGADNDTIFGGEGADALQGDSGDDSLVGDHGQDELLGNAGNDTLRGGDQADTMDGGDGADTDVIDYSTVNYADATFGVSAGRLTVTIGGVTDIISNTERLTFADRTVLLVDAAGLISDVTSVASAVTTSNGIGGAVTVLVAAGSYAENVVIGRSDLQLLSLEGRATTAIAGNDAGGELGAVQFAAGLSNVQLGATGMGFTINGLNGNGGIEKAAVYLVGNQNGHTIQGNEIVAEGDAGLMSEGSGDVDDLTIDGNIFSGQTFVGVPEGPGFGNQFGLGNNVPRQLVVLGNGGGGSPASSNIVFTNNQVTGTAGATAGADTESAPIGPQGNTLVTIDATDSLVEDNTFTGFTDRFATALRVRGPGTDVIDNTFDHTTGGGSRGITVTNANGSSNFSGNILIGGAGAENITSMTPGADTLLGNGGADTLVGSGGNDLMDGGAGDDGLGGLVADLAGDTLVGGADIDTLGVAGTGTLTLGTEDTGIEHILVLGTDATNVDASAITGLMTMTGNGLANNLAAGEGAQTLSGLGGNDTLDGGGDGDSLDGGTGNDQLLGGLGNDTVAGGSGNDTLTGGAGNDSLAGGADLDTAAYAETLTALDITYGTAWQVGGDTLTGVEIVDGAEAGRFLLVGGGGFAGLQAAIDAAVAGDTIMLSADFAGTGLVIVDKDITIRGVATTATVEHLRVTASGVTLENFTILDGRTESGFDSAGVYVSGAGDNLTVSNMTFTRAGSPDGFRGIITELGAVTGLSVTGSSFTGWATGIYANPGALGTISGNTFTNNVVGISSDALPASGLSITDNDFVDGVNTIEHIGVFTAVDGSVGDVVGALNTFTAGIDPVSVYLGGGDISVTGSAYDDRFYGTGGNETLNGAGGNDTIDGGAGNDVLNGGAGADSLDGGLGNDLYIVDSGSDIFSDAGGADTVRGSVDVFGGDDIEVIELIAGGIGGYGGSGDQTIIASNDGNLLFGGEGADSMAGGSGNDTFYVDETGDQLSDTGGHDLVVSAVSWTLAAGFEDLELTAAATGAGNSGDNELTGSEGADSLFGDAGHDTLFGGEGSDTLLGGTGNDEIFGGEGDDWLAGRGGDTYDGGDDIDTLDFTTAGVNVAIDLNITAAQSTGSLGDVAVTGVEVVLTGSGNDSLRGTAAAETLSGGNGADTIEGGDGGDSIVGGDGSDWVSYANAADGITINLEEPDQNLGEAAADTLSGIENVLGSAFDDIITGLDFGGDTLITGDMLVGGGGNDLLEGLDGADTLVGNSGEDTFAGGSGNDLVTYASSASGLTISLANPNHSTGDALGDVFFSVETVAGSDFGDSMVGSGFDDGLDGGAGNDTLSGGLGGDTLIGGAGEDVVSYAFASASVTVNLNTSSIQNTGGGGFDRLFTIENAIGSAQGDNLVGSTAANRLEGGLGNDVLSGNAGNDTLLGGDGTDNLNGGTDSDRLQGGTGRDTLTGGAGVDTFVWASVAEGGNTTTTADRVSDFGTGAQRDLFDLSGIGGLSFIGGAAFSAANQVRVQEVGAVTQIQVNTDANLGTTEMFIVLTGIGHNLTSADFIL